MTKMQPEILHNTKPKHFVAAILYRSCARTLQSAELYETKEISSQLDFRLCWFDIIIAEF